MCPRQLSARCASTSLWLNRRAADPQMRQSAGAGQVVDGGHRQAQQLSYLLGGQQPVIEWHG